jgi:hypothetical protein
MALELSRGWRQLAKFSGVFAGCMVEGIKYIGERGEIGWSTTLRTIRNSIHDLSITRTKFYEVKVSSAGEVAYRRRIGVFEGIEDACSAESRVALEAIRAWEKQLQTESHRRP